MHTCYMQTILPLCNHIAAAWLLLRHHHHLLLHDDRPCWFPTIGQFALPVLLQYTYEVQKSAGEYKSAWRDFTCHQPVL